MARKYYDVAVVGGGLLGASCALRLALKGASVTLLERNRDIGMEASGVNAGTISMQVDNPKLITLRLQGLEHWKSISDLCGEDIGLKRIGGLSIATNEKDVPKLKKRIKSQRSKGLNNKALSNEEIRSMKFLSDKVLAAVYCDLDSYCDPRNAMYILKKALLMNNVNIRFLSEVLSLESLPGDKVRVTLADESFETGAAVIAAGVWASEINTGWFKKYIPPFYLYPRAQQAMVTEPVPMFIPHLVIDVSSTLSLKQYDSGKIVIGGAWPGLTDADYMKKVVVGESIIGNCRTAIHAIRNIEKINLIRVWSGIESETQDLLPIIGPIPASNRIFYIKTGFGGFTIGHYLSYLVSEMICGNYLKEAEPYYVDRFKTPDPYVFQ